MCAATVEWHHIYQAKLFWTSCDDTCVKHYCSVKKKHPKLFVTIMSFWAPKWCTYLLYSKLIFVLVSGSTLQCGTWLRGHVIEFARWQHLQCDTWLWDDMPLNSSKSPPYYMADFWTNPYWNCTSGFGFNHISYRSQHVIVHNSEQFYPNRIAHGRKMRD